MSVRDVFVEELKDLYSAEQQLLEALPKLIKNVSSSDLRKVTSVHLEETKKHVDRLDQISILLGEELDGKTCKAMKGLLKEAEDIFEEKFDNNALKDILLIGAAQRVEHYEMAGYGNAHALAEFLDEDKIATLLQETLEEEKTADLTLTDVCQQDVLVSCDAPMEGELAANL